MSVRVKIENSNDGSEINVKVVSQMNELDPYFRVKCDEPLQQLMIRWSARANIQDYRSIRFLLDGTRIGENQTADDIGLEDGDFSDAMTDQIGG